MAVDSCFYHNSRQNSLSINPRDNKLTNALLEASTKSSNFLVPIFCIPILDPAFVSTLSSAPSVGSILIKIYKRLLSLF